MSAALTGSETALGFSCSSKISRRLSSSSSTRCCVKISISVDEKKKSFHSSETENAFNSIHDRSGGAQDLKKKEKELQAKEAELRRQEQDLKRKEDVAARAGIIIEVKTGRLSSLLSTMTLQMKFRFIYKDYSIEAEFLSKNVFIVSPDLVLICITVYGVLML